MPLSFFVFLFTSMLSLPSPSQVLCMPELGIVHHRNVGTLQMPATTTAHDPLITTTPATLWRGEATNAHRFTLAAGTMLSCPASITTTRLPSISSPHSCSTCQSNPLHNTLATCPSLLHRYQRPQSPQSVGVR